VINDAYSRSGFNLPRRYHPGLAGRTFGLCIGDTIKLQSDSSEGSFFDSVEENRDLVQGRFQLTSECENEYEERCRPSHSPKQRGNACQKLGRFFHCVTIV
jgi:hypothetical protein